jgi:hypothetical protein
MCPGTLSKIRRSLLAACLWGLALSLSSLGAGDMRAAAPSPLPPAPPRPGMDKGPTQAGHAVWLGDVNSIDSVGHSLEGNFLLILRWRDPSLAHKDPHAKPFAADDIWHPRFLIPNSPEEIYRSLPEVAYQIRFGSVSAVLIGALILANVVLILEHVPLGSRLRNQPVLVDVTLRTLLYAFGTLIVILLEKAFESRPEQGGFGPALMNVFQHRDMPHVWANTIFVTGA